MSRRSSELARSESRASKAEIGGPARQRPAERGDRRIGSQPASLKVQAARKSLVRRLRYPPGSAGRPSIVTFNRRDFPLTEKLFWNHLPVARRGVETIGGRRRIEHARKSLQEHQIFILILRSAQAARLEGRRIVVQLLRHFDYIHFNPVKHGYAARVQDWPCSSFRRWVRLGGLSGKLGRRSRRWGAPIRRKVTGFAALNPS
jgi:hypothetical protein